MAKKKSDFVFTVEDFVSAASWAVGNMVQSDSVLMGQKDGKFFFSSRDKKCFVMSYAETVSAQSEDDMTVDVPAENVAAVLKAAPKDGELSLELVKNEQDEISSLKIVAGHVRTAIPCSAGKAPKIPEMETACTVDMGTFAAAFNSARTATDHSKNAPENMLGCVDVRLYENEDGDTLLSTTGTDRYIVSQTKMPLTPGEGWDDIKGTHFMVPAFSANVKTLSSLAAGVDTIELAYRPDSKDSMFGLLFPGGNLCVFSCAATENMEVMDKFVGGVDEMGLKIEFTTAQLKDGFRTVAVLAPQDETPKMLITPEKVVFSDKTESTTVAADTPSVPTGKGEDEEELTAEVRMYTTTVINRALACVPGSECDFLHSVNNDKIVGLRSPCGDSETTIVICLAH